MRRITTPTTDLIGSIVDLLQFEFQTLSVTDNEDGTFTLATCNTYHIQPGFSVVINSVTYKVLSIVRNINIVIEGTIQPPRVNFNIYSPYYFHGTPTQTSAELTQIALSEEKLPMVYLTEDMEESYYGKNSNYDRDAPCRIFFLTESDTSWLTEQFHDYAINPMRELALEFIEKVRSRPQIFGKFEENGFKIATRQRVGITTSGKDKKNFTTQSLSGVELNITLPIVKGAVRCPCNIIVTPSGTIVWEDMTGTWESYTDEWETYQ